MLQCQCSVENGLSHFGFDLGFEMLLWAVKELDFVCILVFSNLHAHLDISDYTYIKTSNPNLKSHYQSISTIYICG
mgnify:CR=1 FL=1